LTRSNFYNELDSYFQSIDLGLLKNLKPALSDADLYGAILTNCTKTKVAGITTIIDSFLDVEINGVAKSLQSEITSNNGRLYALSYLVYIKCKTKYLFDLNDYFNYRVKNAKGSSNLEQAYISLGSIINDFHTTFKTIHIPVKGRQIKSNPFLNSFFSRQRKKLFEGSIKTIKKDDPFLKSSYFTSLNNKSHTKTEDLFNSFLLTFFELRRGGKSSGAYLGAIAYKKLTRIINFPFT